MGGLESGSLSAPGDMARIASSKGEGVKRRKAAPVFATLSSSSSPSE